MREFEKAYIATQDKCGASALSIGDANLLIALDTSVERGAIVGQISFNTQLKKDCLYYLNPERTPSHELNSNWIVPQYETPQDRLCRPTILNTGVNKTIHGPLQERLLQVRAELDSLNLVASKYNLWGKT